jgi:hypothetical protein
MGGLMSEVPCSLTLQTGERQVRLDCTCHVGSEYAATNALMNEMHDRIKQARNRELAGLDTTEDTP